jgi:hypothetical protein
LRGFFYVTASLPLVNFRSRAFTGLPFGPLWLPIANVVRHDIRDIGSFCPALKTLAED